MEENDPLVDGDALLTVTAELRDLRARIDGAEVGEDQRRRWRHAIAAIAEGATNDLETASGQLRRLSARLDRAGVE